MLELAETSMIWNSIDGWLPLGTIGGLGSASNKSWTQEEASCMKADRYVGQLEKLESKMEDIAKEGAGGKDVDPNDGRGFKALSILPISVTG